MGGRETFYQEWLLCSTSGPDKHKRGSHVSSVDNNNQFIKMCKTCSMFPARNVFLATSYNYVDTCVTSNLHNPISRLSQNFGLPPSMVASYGASFLVKKCAEQAFSKYHRSMLAGDMVAEVSTAFHKYIEPR